MFGLDLHLTIIFCLIFGCLILKTPLFIHSSIKVPMETLKYLYSEEWGLTSFPVKTLS